MGTVFGLVASVGIILWGVVSLMPGVENIPGTGTTALRQLVREVPEGGISAVRVEGLWDIEFELEEERRDVSIALEGATDVEPSTVVAMDEDGTLVFRSVKGFGGQMQATVQLPVVDVFDLAFTGKMKVSGSAVPSTQLTLAGTGSLDMELQGLVNVVVDGHWVGEIAIESSELEEAELGLELTGALRIPTLPRVSGKVSGLGEMEFGPGTDQSSLKREGIWGGND